MKHDSGTKMLRRRGAVAVMGIAVLGVTFATAVALMISLSNRFTYLRADQDRAQLEQYELATIVLARQQLGSGKQPTNGPLQLPPGAPAAAIEWQPATDNRQTCTITIGTHITNYSFVASTSGWSLVEVD